jgi:hypothetical protein
MSNTPDALRLADWLEHRTNIMLQDRQAAAELRRLHAEVEKLRQAQGGDAVALRLLREVVAVEPSGEAHCLSEGDTVYISPPLQADARKVPQEVIDFLCGAAPLDGVWFGDRHPKEKGAYWWRKRLSASPAAPTQVETQALSKEEVDVCRQWFDALQDVHGGYLNPLDYTLASKLYQMVGLRVPDSIAQIADPSTPPIETSLQWCNECGEGFVNQCRGKVAQQNCPMLAAKEPKP